MINIYFIRTCLNAIAVKFFFINANYVSKNCCWVWFDPYDPKLCYFNKNVLRKCLEVNNNCTYYISRHFKNCC